MQHSSHHCRLLWRLSGSQSPFAHRSSERACAAQDGETGGLRIQTAAPRPPSSPVQHPAPACCAGMSWCCCFVS
ncbi:hypothetical protein Nmel_017115, partial [Mimus melanotis]